MRNVAVPVRLAGVAIATALGVALPLGVAGASPVYPNGGTPPSVSPEQVTPHVAAKTAAKPAGTLPFTGGDVAQLAAIGGAAAVGGLLLVRRSRRTVAR